MVFYDYLILYFCKKSLTSAVLSKLKLSLINNITQQTNTICNKSANSGYNISADLSSNFQMQNARLLWLHT